MREVTSVHNKIIDRNWVMKRKRKRLLCGPDLSNGKESIVVPSESPSNNPPDKRRLKGDSSSVRSSRKKKGNDGYYFECVICDLGGNLLCCDSCPRTYHLQCLNPPLKRTPPGKWQCPNCCGQNGSVKSISNPEIISKRARTKIILKKSKMGIKLTGSDKVSQTSESYNAVKHRSSGKGKSTFSCSVPSVENKLDSSQTDMSCRSKSSHSSHGGSVEGNSPCANIDIEKKSKLSCTGTSGNRKSSSPIRDVQSSDGNLDLEPEPNDEPSEKKSDLPCHKGSPGSKLNPTLGCASQKVRKRKQKINREGSQKKPRADKGKCAVNTSRKRGTKAASLSPETGKPHQKRNSVAHQVSTSMSKEDLGTKTLGIQQKDMKLPEETSHLSHELDELRAEVDKTETCEENPMVEVQQVDRILGCRMHSTDTISSSLNHPIKCSASPTHENNSTRVASDTPLRIPENNDRLLDDIPVGKRVADVEDPDGSHSAVNQIDRGKSTETETKVDKLRVYRRCVAKECIGGDAMGSTRRYLKVQGCTTVSSEVRDESAANREDDGRTTDKGVMVERIDVECVNGSIHGDNPALGACETPIPCDRYTKDAEMEMKVNNSGENKIQESMLEESMPSAKDTAMYEFFVKWVGQSHIHNSWVSECQLKVLAKRKLENYKAKYGTAVINICQDEWRQPQKVIALRASKDGITEAFVKWSGLPYDECTWERIDDPVIEKSSHLVVRFKQFESQMLDNAGAKDDLLKSKSPQTEIFPLIEQPKELKGGSLFPHQLEALNWLRKCWHKSKNVILADEMGLGKTVSACAFISSLYFEFKARLPCLVLVPLSTMPNWLSEFSLWAPNLNVVEYHGCAKARSIIRQYEWIASDTNGFNKRTGSYKFNVLLTTYEMVLADSSHLRGVPWEVLVVDEGHRLKNSESKLFSLLNTFSFQHRVLLTGTPLQNNIGEMYNLLNFLQPASFPSLSSFEEKFNDLTTAEKAEELKKLVAPHMLRRLKKDVMQNIPPKTERMVPVELSSIQAEYYRAMLTKNYQILRNIGKGVPQQSMLNIVMQLRKVCNHPYLIPGTEPDSGSIEFLQEMRIKASAKLTLLHSMLKVLNKEGHRVLIFSQMTKLLDILEDYLTIEFGPKTFERVDGSVSVADRQAAIARFNQDKSRFVFLLSTRSCGLGINLATADTVIIYDSDFNPHADIQAMNRAHRIGQTNRLLVYRLVVRASVEERILQLARKKLMLDQLFMNKSESQKEVEDILRWGTEELFSDSSDVTGKDRTENSNNKDEAMTDIEHKHRRRAGGLGDVYKDKCTDGSTKLLWDENAISRLLDRSILQSVASEGAEGDLENDMLGSVKSLEWNDEATEEQGRTELPSAVTGDACAPSSERKDDDVLIGTEENEWDRLLRVRWEKYQNEEEAALGRGKRLRKAVSYSEAFIPHPGETLSESGNEEEEREPEREYTPAGRALKAKFARLRARQKERLAQRNMTNGYCPTDGQFVPGIPSQFPATNAKEGEHISKSVDSIKVQSSVIVEDNQFNPPLDASKNKSESTLKLARVSKQGYRSIHSSHLDLSVRPPGSRTSDIFIPNHQAQSMSHMNLAPSDNLLPVLGLCAPNANQMESAHRNRHESYNMPKSNSIQIRTGMNLPEFPFSVPPGAGTSGEMEIKGQENAGHACTSDFSQHYMKRRILDSCFPFSSYPLTNTRGRSPDPLENSGSAFPVFREKMVLPNFAFEEQHIPKYSFPSKNMSKSFPDLFPSLSLGTRVESAMQDLPTMPLLPNFRLSSQDSPKQNRQVREVPPTLGLGQMQSTYTSLPENHKKVLDNIMMRTGSGANNLFKKRSKVTWSEDELDTLWIGVRRHGRGNWDAMLRDPKLKFSKHRTPDDMSLRWEEEQVKIFDEAAFPAPKSSKSTLFLGISDGMMARALHGSRLAGPGKEYSTPMKFKSHLTDMQLGYGDPTSGLMRGEPSDNFCLENARYSPFPAWKSGNFQSNFTGDFPAGPSDRSVASSNLHLEQPFMLNSLGSSALGSLGINCSSSCDLQQKEDEQGANKHLKLSPIHGSLNSLHNSHNYNMCTGESSTNRLVPDPNKELNIPVKDDATGSNSIMNKLPHWLREAVSVPAKPPEPVLPPTVSAIAHSVRLLYGEEKQTIPPFTVPGPPPCQPKDPRRKLKKKWRLHKLRRRTPEMATSSKNFQNSFGDGIASGSIPLASPLPPSTARTSRFPWIEPNLNLPSLNLNLMNSESPSSYLDHMKKPGMGLSPSPEVLQLVASCVAPDPHISPVPGMASSSFHGSDLALPNPLEPIGQGGGLEELKDLHGKQKAGQSLLLDKWGQLPVERTVQTQSGDSSKTHSDPRQIDRPEVEAISSEETVSDDHGCEQEP